MKVLFFLWNSTFNKNIVVQIIINRDKDISSDTVTGGNVKFVNVKPQYVGLRIYKTFTDSEGESIIFLQILGYYSFQLSCDILEIPVEINNFYSDTVTSYQHTAAIRKIVLRGFSI